jgi:Niemann-Pick C1 protein
MVGLWQLATVLLLTATARAEPYTPKHEAGRCSIRGTCGKDWLGHESPCSDNGLASEPEDEVRAQLVELCGAKWSTGPVCCEGAQVCITCVSYSLAKLI